MFNQFYPTWPEYVRNKMLEFEKSLACLGKKYDKPVEATLGILNSFTQTYISQTYGGQRIESSS